MELITASSKGDLETVQRLIGTGVSANSADYDKRTALHVAVAEKRLEVVKFLLEKGADPNVPDR
jgi:glutaminase